MKNFLKEKFPIILAIWPYLFFLIYLIPEDDGETLSSIFLFIYAFLTVLVYLSNMIYAFLYKGKDACYHTALWNMVIKLIHVPFFFICFLCGILSLLCIVVPIFTMMAPFIIFMLFIVDVLLMITSSMYGISALIQAKRKKIISTKYLIVNLILHFIFVADVISAVVLYVKLRKAAKQQIEISKELQNTNAV